MHERGHRIRELAALLDVPEGTVESHLFLARQTLRRHLRRKTRHRTDLLSDNAIDRMLHDALRVVHNALRVDPSPAFLARVRTHIADQSIVRRRDDSVGE